MGPLNGSLSYMCPNPMDTGSQLAIFAIVEITM
jgi:hypothetical protein